MFATLERNLLKNTSQPEIGRITQLTVFIASQCFLHLLSGLGALCGCWNSSYISVRRQTLLAFKCGQACLIFLICGVTDAKVFTTYTLFLFVRNEGCLAHGIRRRMTLGQTQLAGRLNQEALLRCVVPAIPHWPISFLLVHHVEPVRSLVVFSLGCVTHRLFHAMRPLVYCRRRVQSITSPKPTRRARPRYFWRTAYGAFF